MARNKRKKLVDREKMKGIRIEAKKRWRNKKAKAKCLKNAVELARESEAKPAVVAEAVRPSMSCQLPEPEQGFAEPKPAKHCEAKKSPVVVDVLGSTSKTKKSDKTRTRVSAPLKEINPSEVVKSEIFLGCGSFGTCYLAYYRGISVAVKEFKPQQSRSQDEITQEVLREAQMIGQLGDHRGLPLLFGVITKSLPLRLITQFHGKNNSCSTLHKVIKKGTLDKPSWLGILKKIMEALNHMHKAGVVHNDIKSNNVVLEKPGEQWNPVIIDFGKARHIANPKPLMDLSPSAQEEYRRSYPHIAPEIVTGKGQQSVASDVFSFGKIALKILNLLPTATELSLKVAKKLTSDDPAKRPSLNEFAAVL